MNIIISYIINRLTTWYIKLTKTTKIFFFFKKKKTKLYKNLSKAKHFAKECLETSQG
jgi:hypothetical protein